MGQLYWTTGCQILGRTFFWEFLAACFWMWLTFKSVNCVKQMILPNVGGPHSMRGRPAYKKIANSPRKENSSCLTDFKPDYWLFSTFRFKWKHWLFLGLMPDSFWNRTTPLVPWLSGLLTYNGIYSTGFPWSPASANSSYRTWDLIASTVMWINSL